MPTFVGAYSWTDVPARGIAVVEAGTVTGTFTDIVNPFHLALSPSGQTLYVASNAPEGRVFALRVGDDGSLTPLNDQSAEGAGTIHVLVHSGHLYATNHDSGEVVVFPINPDESLGPVAQSVKHLGAGPDALSQLGPHPHMTIPDPTGTRVLVPDKGNDQLYVYRLEEGLLVPHSQVHLGAGTGPRQLVFNPDGRHLYVVNELVSSITVCGYDPSTGALWTVGTAPTLPEGADGWNAPSGIALSADGRFVYVANRGHESLTVLRVAKDGAHLEPVDTLRLSEEPLSTMPWDLVPDPSGTLLHLANQTAGTVVAFTVDPETGLLSPSDTPAVEVQGAACLLLR
ncbi:lactonase family protein [Streptosporangium sp. NPDC051023]|uniref:lactonase family protein n=1 Tax=Streptosporangium sp. NPDC051023 TaxID=3155410 RepID=UPI00344CE663